MFLETALDSIRTSIKNQRFFPLLLLLGGCCVSGYGVWAVYAAQNTDTGVTQVVTCSDEVTHEVNRVLSVVGAVNNPGIYHFSSDIRVGEALEKAGGLSSEADILLMQKTTNLAQKVADGESIFIPSVKERDIEQFCAAVSHHKSGNLRVETSSANTTVSINTATVQQLESLPSIGEKRAQAIVEGRPYTTISELVDKAVISDVLFEEIKSQLIL